MSGTKPERFSYGIEPPRPCREAEGGKCRGPFEQPEAERGHNVADAYAAIPKAAPTSTRAVRIAAINNGSPGKAASTSAGRSPSPAVTRSAAPTAGSQ